MFVKMYVNVSECTCTCAFIHMPTASADVLKCVRRGWGEIFAGTKAAV